MKLEIGSGRDSASGEEAAPADQAPAASRLSWASGDHLDSSPPFDRCSAKECGEGSTIEQPGTSENDQRGPGVGPARAVENRQKMELAPYTAAAESAAAAETAAAGRGPDRRARPPPAAAARRRPARRTPASASSAAGPRAASSCARACGRGEPLPPFPGPSFPMAFRSGREASSRGKCPRAASFSSAP